MHLDGVDGCQRLRDLLGHLGHDVDVAVGEQIGVLHAVVGLCLGLHAGSDALSPALLGCAVSLALQARSLGLCRGFRLDTLGVLLSGIQLGVGGVLTLDAGASACFVRL